MRVISVGTAGTSKATPNWHKELHGTLVEGAYVAVELIPSGRFFSLIGGHNIARFITDNEFKPYEVSVSPHLFPALVRKYRSIKTQTTHQVKGDSSDEDGSSKRRKKGMTIELVED